MSLEGGATLFNALTSEETRTRLNCACAAAGNFLALKAGLKDYRRLSAETMDTVVRLTALLLLAEGYHSQHNGKLLFEGLETGHPTIQVPLSVIAEVITLASDGQYEMPAAQIRVASLAANGTIDLIETTGVRGPVSLSEVQRHLPVGEVVALTDQSRQGWIGYFERTPGEPSSGHAVVGIGAVPANVSLSNPQVGLISSLRVTDGMPIFFQKESSSGVAASVTAPDLSEEVVPRRDMRNVHTAVGEQMEQHLAQGITPESVEALVLSLRGQARAENGELIWTKEGIFTRGSYGGLGRSLDVGDGSTWRLADLGNGNVGIVRVLSDGSPHTAYDCRKGAQIFADALREFGRKNGIPLDPQLLENSTDGFTNDVFVQFEYGGYRYRISFVPTMKPVEVVQTQQAKTTESQWNGNVKRWIAPQEEEMLHLYDQKGIYFVSGGLRPTGMSEGNNMRFLGMDLIDPGHIEVNVIKRNMTSGNISDLFAANLVVPIRQMDVRHRDSELQKALQGVSSNKPGQVTAVLNELEGKGVIRFEARGTMDPQTSRELMAAVQTPLDTRRLTPTEITPVPEGPYAMRNMMARWLATARPSQSTEVVVVPATLLDRLPNERERSAALKLLGEIPKELGTVFVVGHSEELPWNEQTSHLKVISDIKMLPNAVMSEASRTGKEVHVTLLGPKTTDPLARDIIRVLKPLMEITHLFVGSGLRAFLIQLGASLGVPGEGVTEADLKRLRAGLKELQRQV